MWCLVKCFAKEYLKKQNKETNLNIKCGRPVIVIKYYTLKFITFYTLIIAAISIFYSCDMIVSAIKMRLHFGSYLNMVTKNDGDVLPSCLAIPGFITLIINIISLYFLYKVFSESKRRKLNTVLFYFIVFCLIIAFIFIIVCIGVLSDVYSGNEKLHDGITDAMKNYAKDSKVKVQMDMLQIEFQCCGSKKYDEWYDISWYDSSLVRKSENTIDGETPFSCCSVTSSFPCIHHGIEMTGTVYLYTPENNLSVSTTGCFSIIKKRKRIVGWGIIGNILFLIILIIMLLVGLRFLQTAHSELYKFEKDSEKMYTAWLLGYYVGKKRRKSAENPPPVPPIPPELMH